MRTIVYPAGESLRLRERTAPGGVRDRPLAERLTEVLDILSALFRATSPSWDELEARSAREKARRESGKLYAYISETGERRPLGVPPPPRRISTTLTHLSPEELTARANILAELDRVEGLPIASAARIVIGHLAEISELRTELNADRKEADARLEQQWRRSLDEFAASTARLRLDHDLTMEVRESRIDELREAYERALLRGALRARGIPMKRSGDLLRRVPTNAEKARRWEEQCQLIVFVRDCLERSDGCTESAAFERHWTARFPKTTLTGPEFHRRLQELLREQGYERKPCKTHGGRERGWRGVGLRRP